MGKHFDRDITDTAFTYRRDQAGIDAEAALDAGIYVLRTSGQACPPTPSTPPGLSRATRTSPTSYATFASSRPMILDLRPIYHRLDERLPAHVQICLLACYFVWHLRRAWAADLHRRTPTPPRQPVAPAQRSTPSPHQSQPPARPLATPPQLPRPARPPGHPHPQPGPLPRHHHRIPVPPNPPPPSAAPSTSSTHPSRSPSPRSQNNHPTKPTNPQLNPGIRLSQSPVTSV